MSRGSKFSWQTAVEKWRSELALMPGVVSGVWFLENDRQACN